MSKESCLLETVQSYTDIAADLVKLDDLSLALVGGGSGLVELG